MFDIFLLQHIHLPFLPAVDCSLSRAIVIICSRCPQPPPTVAVRCRHCHQLSALLPPSPTIEEAYRWCHVAAYHLRPAPSHSTPAIHCHHPQLLYAVAATTAAAVVQIRFCHSTTFRWKPLSPVFAEILPLSYTCRNKIPNAKEKITVLSHHLGSTPNGTLS